KVDLVHFAEAGPLATDAEVDLAFVEGSISTPEDLQRIDRIRARSRTLVAIGACATAGGVQALRNGPHSVHWLASIYADPEQIESLPDSTPISAHVNVDLELPGCPVTGEQVLAVIHGLLLGVSPPATNEKVCVECKRRGLSCVMVSKGIPCMGPVTHGGCGALCPGMGRDCYGCFGPADLANTDSLTHQFKALGLSDKAIARRYRSINNNAPVFATAAGKALDSDG
ncbi:MAG TPA: sulfhydrogenase subunit delta, partial [Thiobacillaceae bacterium]|nr:sulfhydrogenase subunit delta [Thiobacillaceae bacterium]